MPPCELNIFVCFINSRIKGKYLARLPVAWAADGSKAAALLLLLLLLNHCLLMLPLSVGVCFQSLFCKAVLTVVSFLVLQSTR